MISRLILILAFVLHGVLVAQNKNVSHENQQWIHYYNETKLNKNWILLADVGFRWKNDFKDASQFIARAGMGYAITKDFRVGVGFGYVGFYSQDVLNKVEYRPHQELVYKSALNKVKIGQRLRVEERFFNPVNQGDTPSTISFNFRFRYNLTVSYPLFKLSKSNPDSMFMLSVGDEIFTNAGKDIVTNVFDQNRFVVSPIFQLNKSLSISPTWNSQFSSTTTAGNYKHTQVFWLQIRHNLDLSQGKHTK